MRRNWLCAHVMEHARLTLLTKAITFPSNVHRRRVMQEAVQHGSGQDIILECVIMPLSLIVLHVEAILGDVQHLPLSNIPVYCKLNVSLFWLFPKISEPACFDECVIF